MSCGDYKMVTVINPLVWMVLGLFYPDARCVFHLHSSTEPSVKPEPILPHTFKLIPGRESTSLLTSTFPIKYIR